MTTGRHTSVFGIATAAGLAACALGFGSDAKAFEAGQSANLPSTAAVAMFPLPAFLDSSRLLDFEDAWRSHFGFNDAAVSQAVPPSEASPAVAESQVTAPARIDLIHSQLQVEEAAMQSAQAAIVRAEKVSRETAVVRARAEELSSRFMVATRAVTPAAVDPSIDFSARTSLGGPTQPAAIEPAVLVTSDETPQPMPAGISQQAEPQLQSAAADDAPEIEKMVAVPQSPKRTVAAQARRAPVDAVKSTAVISSSVLSTEAAAPGPDNSGIPTEFQAFGWTSQPSGLRFGPQ